MALQLSRESYTRFPPATTMEDRLPQPEKAPSPMLVTPFGILMEMRLLQSPKAPRPILVTVLGITTDVNASQQAKA